MEVIDFIPIDLDARDLIRTLKNRRMKETKVVPLIEDCRRLIEPTTVYTLLKVTSIKKDEIQLESEYILKSSILGEVLKVNQTVVPYIVTIGPGLEKKASEETKSSILRGFIMECIADYAVEKAAAYVRSLMKEKLGSTISNFTPGSGTGKLFDIKQQEVIFQILNPTGTIGVHLTPSFLMIPRKSLSGIFAATPEEYFACQYCPRTCEYRKKSFSGESLTQHCEYNI
ncbi:vitamin B12 dependent-methionine synthase activation domain-containing protein [Candidatus Borrarchaeum sp.]|uniref:vitamin B12 dependent-methionine synthase activation domain-containing protein n=1 Tax=Candidatus Borrarchaeum sp. TaxID=2846742 RepID=UPI00257E183D|nr:vitamin B12 dependent-methionine synthase activation domain-containing protein [Candidatus Borrarchaeum sp.]